jgi:tryptophanase
MRKGKIQLKEPTKGIIEIHENEDLVRIKIDRKFYTAAHLLDATNYSLSRMDYVF